MNPAGEGGRLRPRVGARVGDGDVEAFTLMTGLADDIDAAMAEAVKGLRAYGYFWAEIGSRLGITCQAAQQRWGQRREPSRATRYSDRR